MATTVIIPARNEEQSIGPVLRAFDMHPKTRGNIYVGIDADTTDKTSEKVWANGGAAFHTDQRGKGQVVAATLKALRQSVTVTGRVILCDADYKGLTIAHIERMLNAPNGMTIGIPDWPDITMPERVVRSWAQVSGFRYLPFHQIPEDAHGYMLETQLNMRAIAMRIPVNYVALPGLISPFTWPLPPQRRRELQRDRKWGEDSGLL